MKLHNRIARYFGYELIRLRKQPSLATHIKQLLRHYEIDLVFDVGANVGQFGKLLRTLDYRGEIYSFEPVDETFTQLEQAAAKDTAWHLHKLALGDTQGEAAINIGNSSDLSSFLAANSFGEHRYAGIAGAGIQQVELGTLDTFMTTNAEACAGKNIFLKLDTQGYDLKVLRGALQSLPKISMLLTELSFIPIYEGMPDHLESLRFCRDHGFLVSGLYPISRTSDLTVVEMDAMFVNSRLGRC